MLQRARDSGASNPVIWEEIERCESFLVSSMYEEAASLATSVLKQVHDNNISSEALKEDIQLHDMMESAGMVLVQSLKELGRTSEILNELKLLYVYAPAIPVQVLLTGACFQISEGSFFVVREFLEEFLSKWSYVDDRCYVLAGAEANVDDAERFGWHIVLGVDEYMEVVEFYVVTLLGTVVNNMDLAVSWVEKAALPEENRQGLLRRLYSLHSLKATNLSQDSFSPLPADNHEAHSSLKEQNVSEGSRSPKALKAKYFGERESKQAILKLSGRLEPCFWWFRSISLPFSNARLVSNGKIGLSCLIFLILYIFRRKQATLKRIAKRQALSMKKVLVDLWQLAFSFQVNPLAAVQPLPAAPHQSR